MKQLSSTFCKSALLGAALLFVAAGCTHSGLGIMRWRRDVQPSPPQGTISAEQLVDYLNKNSERIKTLQCDDVRVTARKTRGILSMNLSGMIVCEQPRNVRMVCTHAGSRMVDVGSNAQEFWYYSSKMEPKAQFFCSYSDLEAGKVGKLPFPFQPEWVLETLLMTKFGPATKYRLQETRDEIRLIERTKGGDGRPVRKIIVFKRGKANVLRGEPQIRAFLLIDEKTGNEICSARIHEAQYDVRNKALLPKRVELRWPKQNMSLTLNFNNPKAAVSIPNADRTRYFTRRPEDGVPSVDLARVRFQPSGIRRVGGVRR